MSPADRQTERTPRLRPYRWGPLCSSVCWRISAAPGIVTNEPPLADRRFVRVTHKSLPTLFRHLAPLVDVDAGRLSMSAIEELDEFASRGCLAADDQNRALPVGTSSRDRGDGSASGSSARGEGLQWLLEEFGDGNDVLVEVFDVSRLELGRELKKYRGTAWDQSPFYKRIHVDAFGTLGGIPYTAVVCDFHLTQSSGDMEMLEELWHIAAAARAPFLLGVA